jgi:hypothetical protein
MEETAIAAMLTSMERDALLQTTPVVVRDTHSIDVLTFREKHLTYLKKHPKVNARNYLANLRTMIKIRS